MTTARSQFRSLRSEHSNFENEWYEREVEQCRWERAMRNGNGNGSQPDERAGIKQRRRIALRWVKLPRLLWFFGTGKGRSDSAQCAQIFEQYRNRNIQFACKALKI